MIHFRPSLFEAFRCAVRIKFFVVIFKIFIVKLDKELRRTLRELLGRGGGGKGRNEFLNKSLSE